MQAFVDSITGTSIVLARYPTLDLPFEQDDSAARQAAHEELMGRDIGRVMAAIGWRYDGMLVRVDAHVPRESASDAARVVATAWAGPISMRDGTRGVNISYAVGSAYRGAGLARLLAYCAVNECLVREALLLRESPSFVNIQAQLTNQPSQGVARALGIPPSAAAAFMVDLEGGRVLEYLGYREAVDGFLGRELGPTLDRLPGYAPGMLLAAAHSPGDRDADPYDDDERAAE